jgi:2-polyprenyl-3-methyl-5-hydroxy-6-metoxy-1,4-benzoquinol methylase
VKEEEIRKRDVLNRYLELVQEDAARLFRYRSTFMTVDCPACGSRDPLHQFVKFGFNYVQCRECETLFVNPRPAYQDLMKMYVDSPSTRFWVKDFFLPTAEVRREKIFKPRAQFIADRFPDLESGRTADIGAGFGIFMEEMKTLWPKADLVAIEPSIDMAVICRDKGLAVLESTLEDVDPMERFDLMTAFELFEHLHDPRPFIEKVYRLLNPGGYLFITTLNGLGFDIQILWERAKSVFPPQHLNFFNPHSMKTLLVRMGFEIIEIATPGQLDWDIIEGAYRHEGLEPGRFFSTVSRHGTESAKQELQYWLKSHQFSSHMRVIARKR